MNPNQERWVPIIPRGILRILRAPNPYLASVDKIPPFWVVSAYLDDGVVARVRIRHASNDEPVEVFCDLLSGSDGAWFEGLAHFSISVWELLEYYDTYPEGDEELSENNDTIHTEDGDDHSEEHQHDNDVDELGKGTDYRTLLKSVPPVWRDVFANLLRRWAMGSWFLEFAPSFVDDESEAVHITPP